ncbi:MULTISPECIES: polyprenyl synthetase family protein [Thalassospira]|uniref:Farnesyltranstransferase n=2 Tax=Thalassospira xiamenensis TaxID=220697 RepID=A0ABR5Y2F2_9PROT|nr:MULTISPECIES: polyprenyl synthetase family protein [Thalassospira]KZD04066.1 farnesyltranstransferase [Thalassospira xiamenensis]KZD10698.1 farnesyltranstransferase [Thalassospira xiamenensis]MDM7977799.1 polyprenyl synthetase family protein [Thalassospira xiamenensis]OHZ04011.1 farnesyltranstransferase [Thalassospira sp. MIT1004]
MTNIATQQTTEPSLDSLIRLVDADMKRVNQVIIDNMHSEVALIPQLASHLVAAGGKRMRPMLTLASAQLCGYQGGTSAVDLAACVEFIHTATLLHDDVVDESLLRRGQASANALFGNEASVLVGDFLFARAFVVMVRNGSLKVLDILAKASAVIAEGEVLQLSTANDMATTEEAYLEVITAKTAALFGAASQIGAVIANRSAEDEEALRLYGIYLGTAFQLIDDVLDYSAHQATLGKTVGDDFRDGKVTLPVIISYAKGDDAEKAFWRRCMEDQDFQDGDLDRAQELIRKYDALSASMDRAREFGQLAIDTLTRFDDGPIKDAMIEAVEFCISRPY